MCSRHCRRRLDVTKVSKAGTAVEIREAWIGVLYKAATGTRRTRTLLTPVGLLVFGVFTGVFILSAVVVDRLLHLPGLLPVFLRIPVSIIILGLGLLVTVWSVVHFLRVNGTPVPLNPPPKVVDTGPYRHVRNPMLTGVFTILLGIGFAIDSTSLVLLFTPLYILANVWELKHIEEPELVKRLGDEYVAYRNRTPAFLPRWNARPRMK